MVLPAVPRSRQVGSLYLLLEDSNDQGLWWPLEESPEEEWGGEGGQAGGGCGDLSCDVLIKRRRMIRDQESWFSRFISWSAILIQQRRDPFNPFRLCVCRQCRISDAWKLIKVPIVLFRFRPVIILSSRIPLVSPLNNVRLWRVGHAYKPVHVHECVYPLCARARACLWLCRHLNDLSVSS